MAERIRYKEFSNESAIVVTIVSFNAVHELTDIDSLAYFIVPPSGSFKAPWKAATLQVWRLLHWLRFVTCDRSQELSVAERSLAIFSRRFAKPTAPDDRC